MSFFKIKGSILVIVGLLCLIACIAVSLSSQKAKSQTAYIPGTTLAMDQTPCTSATAISPLPFEANGTTVTCGPWPTPTPFAVGSPNVRTLTAGTALQATDPTKASTFNITMSSTITSSVVGTQSVDAGVYIGGSGVGSSGGTLMCEHKNAQTLGLVVAFSLAQTITTSCKVDMASGSYIAIRNITGAVTVITATDQSEG